MPVFMLLNFNFRFPKFQPQRRERSYANKYCQPIQAFYVILKRKKLWNTFFIYLFIEKI